MKTIKYIIISVVILSMTMGSFTRLLAQDDILFAETYKQREIISLLDREDRFFELLDRTKTDPEQARLGSCPEESTGEVWDYLHSKEVQSHFPDDLRFAWGRDKEDGKVSLYALRKSSGKVPVKQDLVSVKVQQSRKNGSYNLLLSMNDEGAEKWARLTRENIGRNIAIMMEGRVLAAPVVQAEIREGKCLISGNFSKEESARLKTLLEQ